MKYLLIILMLAATSCHMDYGVMQEIDPATQSYVERFQRVCNIPVFSSIVLKDMPDGYFGHCKNFGPNSNLNVVYVNRIFWSMATDIQKEIVMFHELGHCVLDRRHLPGLTQVGNYPNGPISLMFPTPYGYEPVFEENKNYYYKELCGGKL